jgi:hypothetical protein
MENEKQKNKMLCGINKCSRLEKAKLFWFFARLLVPLQLDFILIRKKTFQEYGIG